MKIDLTTLSKMDKYKENLLVSDDAGLKYSVKNKKIRIKNFKNEKSWIKKIKEII